MRWWYPKNGSPERRHLYVGEVTSAAPAAPEPTRLVLIRHGESRSTIDRVVGGHEGCGGLTDRGVLQAKALYERLDRTGELAGATTLLTSVLPRAIQTAEIIAPALGDLTPLQRGGFVRLESGQRFRTGRSAWGSCRAQANCGLADGRGSRALLLQPSRACRSMSKRFVCSRRCSASSTHSMSS